MVQPTKLAPAILDYVKKVKPNISMSHPYPPQIDFVLLPWDRVLISGSDPQRGKQNETNLKLTSKKAKVAEAAEVFIVVTLGAHCRQVSQRY